MPMTRAESALSLKPETLKAFAQYVCVAESKMKNTESDADRFLWSDGPPAIARQLQSGGIAAEFFSGQGPVKVTNGLIHDWIGALFIPGTTIAKTLALIQNYDDHKVIYAPD